MEGYCKKYAWEMTAQDIKKMGCLSEEKQCKYNRKRCKHFVTKVFIIGDGPRIIQDRGSRIENKNIDPAVETREEAFAWGRKKQKCQKEEKLKDLGACK